MQIGVITNPHSRKNKNKPDRARRLQSIVGDLGEVHTTDSVDSIKPVLRDFLRKRARYWVADGGDGALHWMLRMGMEVLAEDEFAGGAGSYSLPMTMPTNGGTIDFIANNVGIKGDAETLLATLRNRIEHGHLIEETEVDSMMIDGVEVTPDGDVPFRTYGFAVAAGGVGQRFFAKYYEDQDPNARTIMKVVANTLASMPVALSPLKKLMPRAASYAQHMFSPTRARVNIDGMILPGDQFTGIHVASMSINLGNVLKFFGKADQPGLMNALVGTPDPMTIAWNLPRMMRGREMVGRTVLDRPCRTMTIEARGDELLEPVIDGEYYRNLRSMSMRIGPRVHIPKVVGKPL
jgi:diacylglycerol kinase family enzyme